MTRMILHLSDREFGALQCMAGHDFRDLGKQVRWLIVQEAQERGLLTNESSPSIVAEGEKHDESVTA